MTLRIAVLETALVACILLAVTRFEGVKYAPML